MNYLVARTFSKFKSTALCIHVNVKFPPAQNIIKHDKSWKYQNLKRVNMKQTKSSANLKSKKKKSKKEVFVPGIVFRWNWNNEEVKPKSRFNRTVGPVRRELAGEKGPTEAVWKVGQWTTSLSYGQTCDSVCHLTRFNGEIIVIHVFHVGCSQRHHVFISLVLQCRTQFKLYHTRWETTCLHALIRFIHVLILDNSMSLPCITLHEKRSRSNELFN